MKKYFVLSIVVTAVFANARVFADNPEDYYEDYNASFYDLYFYQAEANYNDQDIKPEIPDKGNRKPSRRIYGSISKAGGLKIDGVNISEIYIFEIYDAEGVCIGTFCDANDFVQAVFSYHGNMELRLHTAKHILLGNI